MEVGRVFFCNLHAGEYSIVWGGYTWGWYSFYMGDEQQLTQWEMKTESKCCSHLQNRRVEIHIALYMGNRSISFATIRI